MTIEITIILVLILANGIFAGTELAILGAKRGRLEQHAADGSAGAAAALRLQDDPNRFLSAVQVGITLIGILTGAFGGASIAARLSPSLSSLPVVGPYATQLAFGIVVVVITFFTLVFGELVPKRLALLKAEQYAMLIATPMTFIARLSSPVVSLLAFSTQLVLRLLGLDKTLPAQVTEEDIQALVREGASGGEVTLHEQQLIESIFEFSDQQVRQIMTPRRDIVMIEAEATLGQIMPQVLEDGYSRFPIYQDTPDQIIGIVHVRDLLMLYHREGEAALVRSVISPPLYVAEHSLAAQLLATFRKQQRHMAIVVGEEGGVEGLVTLEDVLEEIVGNIEDEFDEPEPEFIVSREDGSWLIDGRLPTDDLKALLEVDELPDETIYRYDTLAGLVITLLGHIPTTGDHVEWDRWRFEVVDMDGRRIDRILLSKHT
ncbi:hemolysin family protein [Candidatus Chloroploca sp. Khr17]|uniref:hemolysin family protein n=1 Tax=Candidatus Chloroploca sp. Khr17 TaxID=2496869 RepID=UPI00101E00F3|nr:hemolysin family protein [Candidatus Chloroploca sp. Khr17]